MSVRRQGRESGAASRKRAKCRTAGSSPADRPWLRALGVAISVCALAGCEDERPAGPTTQEFNQERDALAAKIGNKPATAKPAARKAAPAAADGGGGFAADAGDFTYDPNGRR